MEFSARLQNKRCAGALDRHDPNKENMCPLSGRPLAEKIYRRSPLHFSFPRSPLQDITHVLYPRNTRADDKDLLSIPMHKKCKKGNSVRSCADTVNLINDSSLSCVRFCDQSGFQTEEVMDMTSKLEVACTCLSDEGKDDKIVNKLGCHTSSAERRTMKASNDAIGREMGCNASPSLEAVSISSGGAQVLVVDGRPSSCHSEGYMESSEAMQSPLSEYPGLVGARKSKDSYAWTHSKNEKCCRRQGQATQSKRSTVSMLR
ncbi:hypothetical protein KP509_21G084400 [Ceratopteris richardii]|uniref:Uncharacterized protein n=1 Tax=Ceratopteris richardii TaxID=49495 RepID=A0A8T2SC07_CERRI|nr:hypothetical protein KP509_21G084400 [Ceratopteris richardii]